VTKYTTKVNSLFFADIFFENRNFNTN